MINILSYVGMSLQSEVCLWSLLGLVRTIFDATLFKVNANLKQVWQMTMPAELSRPVQRTLRTMISGIMLVQCFTVYLYLASYIVLLYPVFLEERPTLVLPWLLLAAIRKLLCELTSLAIGLGTCVLLGPARPPCIKFVVTKVVSIMPSVYMWLLLYSYYHVLKVASIFKSFPVVLNPAEHDYGLELAVRRRRTKSLLGEQQLRTTLIANLYNQNQSIANPDAVYHKSEYLSRMSHSTEVNQDDLKDDANILQPLSATSNRLIPDTSYEDCFGTEIIMHRDTDRILEQFVLMMLRIGAYLTREGADLNATDKLFEPGKSSLDCKNNNSGDSIPVLLNDTDTPPLVGNNKGKIASYLRDYPQIFMKKSDVDFPLPSNVSQSLVSGDTSSAQIDRILNKKNGRDVKLDNKYAKTNANEEKMRIRSSEKSVAFKEIKLMLTMQEDSGNTNSWASVTEKNATTDSLINDENICNTAETSTYPYDEVDSITDRQTSSTSIIGHDMETSISNISISIKQEVKKTKDEDT